MPKKQVRQGSIPPSLPPERAIELLRKQLERLEESATWRHDDPRVSALESTIEDILDRAFGKPNEKTEKFHVDGLGFSFGSMTDSEYQKNYLDGGRNRKALMEAFIEQLETRVAVEPAAVPEHGRRDQNETGRKVFIGHGGSHIWRELKDFLVDRLDLSWDEFNRASVAGFPTTDRLEQMLGQAGFAFLVLTGEDEHADGTVHARENAVHEVGLFQGRLGFKRAIILLEEGCAEFSNIRGLTQIRFPKGNVSAKFEEIRRVLEREGLIQSNQNNATSPKKTSSPGYAVTQGSSIPLDITKQNLSSMHTAFDLMSTRLKQFAENHAAVWVEPVVPIAEYKEFYVKQPDGENTVLARSNGATVEIPTTRIQEILPATSSTKPLMIVNGRVQWLTREERWRFFPQKPESPNAELGIFRNSNPLDPHAKDVVNALQARGLQCAWTNEPDLARCQADGWEIVYDDDGRYFRSKDRPYEQILITRHS